MKKSFLGLIMLLLSACSDSQDQKQMPSSDVPQNVQTQPNMKSGCDGSCCPHRCTRPKPPACPGK